MLEILSTHCHPLFMRAFVRLRYEALSNDNYEKYFVKIIMLVESSLLSLLH